VSPPPRPQGTDGGWSSATWIGLGGAPTPRSEPDSIVPLPDVVAVGITQDVNADGEASYEPWAEWFYELETGVPPAQPIQGSHGGGAGGGGGDIYLPTPLAVSIGGFNVAPGDGIYASVYFYFWSDPVIST
jgi:Peptidase A4 family